MALATRCPHCQTTFRVVHDQLKLRAGLVRCGACKEIFNGIEHLLSPTEPTLTANTNAPLSNTSKISTLPESSAASTSGAEVVAMTAKVQVEQPQPEEKSKETYIDFFNLDGTTNEPSTSKPTKQSEEVKSTPVQIDENDPLQRMTLIHFADTVMGHHVDSKNGMDVDANEVDDDLSEKTISPNEDVGDDKDNIVNDEPHDPIEKAIDDLQRKPMREDEDEQIDDVEDVNASELSDAEEPKFVTQGRRKQQFANGLRVFMAVASVILCLSLALQSFYVFRTQIAARMPSTQTLLTSMCKVIGCRLNLPTQIDSVTIESNELQALTNSKKFFSLSMLLRNHSGTTQAWPNIELTLNDSNEKMLSRRVFTPSEYLATAQDVAQGFGAATEQSVKLYFEPLLIKPAGYRVYLFYP